MSYEQAPQAPPGSYSSGPSGPRASFWQLWDKEKQCWQDKIAGSVVVPADAYRLS